MAENLLQPDLEKKHAVYSSLSSDTLYLPQTESHSPIQTVLLVVNRSDRKKQMTEMWKRTDVDLEIGNRLEWHLPNRVDSNRMHVRVVATDRSHTFYRKCLLVLDPPAVQRPKTSELFRLWGSADCSRHV